jgi:hypothetical protein
MQGYGDAVQLGVSFVIVMIPALLLNAPLIIVCFFVRRRLRHRQLSSVLACGLAVAGAWLMSYWAGWHRGMFVSPHFYLMYLPMLLALALTGWFLGRWIGWESVMSEREREQAANTVTR